MTHAHSHSHVHRVNTYFLDQLCCLAVCGLIGVTAILGYKTGMLQRVGLHPDFHLPVLAGGWALIAMVVLRGLSVWRRAEATTSAGHSLSHSHSETSKHDNGPEDHDHGWSPWQYAVLIIPAALFFLGVPAEGFNRTRIERELKVPTFDSGTASPRQALAIFAGGVSLAAFSTPGGPVNLKFSELTLHASHQKSREHFEGNTIVLQGQFRPLAGKDNQFTLFRVWTKCCRLDSIVLRAVIVAPEPLQGFKSEDWFEIEGEISFQKVLGRDEWIPVIQLSLKDGIRKIKMPNQSEFDNV